MPHDSRAGCFAERLTVLRERLAGEIPAEELDPAR
jgi:hypothetical protein